MKAGDRVRVTAARFSDRLGMVGTILRPHDHFDWDVEFDDGYGPGSFYESEIELVGHVDFGDEVRVTDPETGGQKGSKLARFDLISPVAQIEEAKVYGTGATKYDDHNWRKGYAWSLSIAALHRHLIAFQGGEDVDPESGLPHMAHVRWHTGVLLEFAARGLGTDDRHRVFVQREVHSEAP